MDEVEHIKTRIERLSRLTPLFRHRFTEDRYEELTMALESAAFYVNTYSFEEAKVELERAIEIMEKR